MPDMPLHPILPTALAADIAHLALVIGERHGGRPAAWTAAETWALERFTALGWNCRREPLPHAPERANVVAERAGADGSWILLGAHLDTVPRGPGADDNASGVAAVLALGAAWRDPPLPGAGLRCVLFADEELMAKDRTLSGSWQHAQACRAAGARIRLALILDTLAYRDLRPGTQHWPCWWMGLVHGRRGDRVVVQADWCDRRAGRLVRGRLRAARIRTTGWWWPGHRWQLKGDQASFLAHGFTAVALTDGDRFRNPHYHRASDLPATLDVPWLAATVRVVADSLEQWVQVDPR
jgi:hypothetical protein